MEALKKWECGQLQKNCLEGKEEWFGDMKEGDIVIVFSENSIKNFWRVISIERIEDNKLRYNLEKVYKNDINKKREDIVYSKYFKFDVVSANKAYMPNQPANFYEIHLNKEYENTPIEEFVFDKSSKKHIYFLTNENILKENNIKIQPRDIIFIVTGKDDNYNVKEIYNYNNKGKKEIINPKDINNTIVIQEYGLKGQYDRFVEISGDKRPDFLKNIMNSIDEKGYYVCPPDKTLKDIYNLLVMGRNRKNKKETIVSGENGTIKDYTKIHQVDENLNISQELCSFNQIFYGVPGCGKSYKIKTILEKNNIPNNQTEKILFYPDYNYTDFIGQLEPKIIRDNGKNKNEITYEFNPGPFSIILKKALTNPNKNYVLVIDEINRGNAPAIFGDIFQLLDRCESGESEFSITNKTISDYLKDGGIGIKTSDVKYIKIPKNLYIFGTMNTSDQNVFTLDTAFKRRWNFEKLSNKFNKENKKDQEQYNKKIAGLENITWGIFQETINSALNQKLKEYGINGEDKQLGKYFAKDDELNNKCKFAYKVLMYLWDDAVKLDRNILFNENDEMLQTLDDVIDGFLGQKGINIFSKDIIDKMTKELKY